MRKFTFRLLMAMVLVVSPILFPLLLLFLLIADGEWPKSGLGELYCWVWERLIRGYP